MLDQQSDERRDFLLETSVLQELCGSLCDAVTGRPDSAGVLARLERENLFRVALDDRREWFRYHHLFAQALNEELGRYRTRRPELHRRAGAWFEATGDLGQAIHHAFAGGDLDTAATLVATHWFELVNLGRVATVRGWLDTFPRPIIDADARLLLVEAWISGLHGDAQAGLRAVGAARRVGYEGEHPYGSGTVEHSAALVRATFPWSDVGAMLSAARSAYESESESECERESGWQAVAALDLGWALILAGESEQAREPLLQAITLASRSEQWLAAGDARALLAEAWVAAGDLRPAEAWIRDALELATRFGIRGPAFGRLLPPGGRHHRRPPGRSRGGGGAHQRRPHRARPGVRRGNPSGCMTSGPWRAAGSRADPDSLWRRRGLAATPRPGRPRSGG